MTRRWVRWIAARSSSAMHLRGSTRVRCGACGGLVVEVRLYGAVAGRAYPVPLPAVPRHAIAHTIACGGEIGGDMPVPESPT